MSAIYSDPVPENRRMDFINNLFGLDFPLRIEPAIYGIASRLSSNYGGGVWEFYALCNGGFYMAPRGVAQFKVSCENGFDGQMSADAFGITACLYAYSQLSFSNAERFSELCASHFHMLRAFALDHRESGAILAAIDRGGGGGGRRRWCSARRLRDKACPACTGRLRPKTSKTLSVSGNGNLPEAERSCKILPSLV